MPRLVSVLLALAMLAGCEDPTAARRRQVEQQVVQVADLARRAEQGFVPVAGEQAVPVAYAEYRQDRIEQLQTELAGLVRSAAAGGPGRVAAQRLLASYQCAGARHQARRAALEWASLSNRVTHMLGDILSIDRAGARARMVQTDEAPLLEAFRDQLGKIQTRLTELDQAVLEHDQQASDLGAEIERLGAEKDRALASAADQRRQAFVEAGQRRLDMHQQAAQDQDQATRLEREIQLLDLKRDGIVSTLDIDRRQQALHQELARWLQEQIDQTQERGDAARQVQDQALKQQQELSQAMYVERFQPLQQQYAESVEAVLVQAAQLAEAAMQTLQSVGAPPGQDREGLAVERLGAAATHMNVLAQHTFIAGSYGRSLQLLADQARRLVPDRAESLGSTAAQVRTAQVALFEQIEATMTAATEMLEALPDEPTRQRYQGILADYKRRAESARIGGATEAEKKI